MFWSSFSCIFFMLIKYNYCYQIIVDFRQLRINQNIDIGLQNWGYLIIIKVNFFLLSMPNTIIIIVEQPRETWSTVACQGHLDFSWNSFKLYTSLVFDFALLCTYITCCKTQWVKIITHVGTDYNKSKPSQRDTLVKAQSLSKTSFQTYVWLAAEGHAIRCDLTL